MQVQKLGGAHQKSCTPWKISVDFGPLQTLIANFSGTALDIQNQPALQTTAIPPAFNEKRPVNFGPLTVWNYMWVRTHYNAIFLDDKISAHRGCCAPKILHALDIDQALIAHTRSGTGVPQKNFNRQNFKFGLKFSVLATITSGLVGVSHKTFSIRRATGQGS